MYQYFCPLCINISPIAFQKEKVATPGIVVARLENILLIFLSNRWQMSFFFPPKWVSAMCIEAVMQIGLIREMPFQKINVDEECARSNYRYSMYTSIGTKWPP